MTTTNNSGGGVNSLVFNTDLLNTYTDSIGGGLLSFPDLNSGILAPLNSVALSLSLVFGLFILGVFILTKIAPDLGSQLSKLPGLGQISHLKGKDWKAFFFTFTIISVLTYIFLGLYSGTGKYATGDGLRGLFMSNQEVYGNKGNEEKDGGGLVTVTIKPLEGIKITGVRFNNGQEDNTTINNNTTRESIIHPKRVGSTKCNYQGLSEISYKELEEKEDCVYPSFKQGMLIVDSFSVQGNVEKLNPVQLYITNDYDGVNKKNLGNTGGNFNVMDSINMQNSKHGIISILRNQSTIASEYGNEGDFLNALRSVTDDIKSILYAGAGRTKLGDKVGTLRNMEGSIGHILGELQSIRKDIVNGINSNEISRKIDNLSNYNLQILGYLDTNNVNDLTVFDKIKDGGSISGKFANVTNRAVNQEFNGTFDRILFGEFMEGWGNDNESITGFKQDKFHVLNDTLGNWMNNLKKHSGKNPLTLEDLKKSLGNKQRSLEIIDKMTGFGTGKNYEQEFLGFLDLYFGSILMSIDSGITGILPNCENGIGKCTYSDGKGVEGAVTNGMLVKAGPSSNFIIQLAGHDLFEKDSHYDNTAFIRAYYPGTMNFILNNSDAFQRTSNNSITLFETNEASLEAFINVFNGQNQEVTKNIPNEIKEGFNRVEMSLRGLSINIQKKKRELERSRGNNADSLSKDEGLVQLNDEFINLMTNNGRFRDSKNLLTKDSYFIDIVNEFKNGETKYKGVAVNRSATSGNDKSKLYGVWDNLGRIEKNQQNFLLSVVLSAIKGDNDVTFVGVEGGQGVEMRKGDIIMGSPGTTIYAFPYPVKLLMTRQMAETIEFVDKDGGTLGFYSDRFDKEGNLYSKGIGTKREVGKLTEQGLYGMVMNGLDKTGESINWLFNPLIGFGVVENGFSRTLLIFVAIVLSIPAFLFFLFKNIILYFLTFLFFIFFIWLFTLDGQPKRVGKKVLAWFVTLSLVPLYGYILMWILWVLHGNDKSLLYEIRNFGDFYALFICLLIAYVPIMIFFGTKRFLFSLIIDGKFDASTLTVGNFLGAGHVFPQRWGDSLDNAIKKKFNQGKELANRTKDKIAEKAGIKKKAVNVSTTGPLGDGINDVSNNDVINKVAGKRDANTMDVTAVQEEQVNKFAKGEFESRASKIQKVLPQGGRISASDKALRTWLKAKKLKGLKGDGGHISEQDLHNRGNVGVMFNNTQDKSQMISGVTPDLINTINSLRNGIKEELNGTERDFARILMMMFDQNKELLVNLSKVLEEVKNKASDPEIKEKLDDSKNTLTAKDLEIIKAIKQEKGIKGEFNQENIRKSLSESFKEIQNGKNLEQNLEKIKALNSFNHTLYNQDKEDKFYNITNSINGILSEMKSRPNPTVEKEITKYIMNGDSQGLNNYKQQNAHIEGLDILIDRIQTMPHEMMKVLNSNATAAEMRNNAAGINEFIGLMKNNQKLEELKHQDMNKYLATMLQIQEFRNSSIEDKMQMASMASVGSIQTIKEANKVTTMLSNEISRMMQSQGNVSHQSITNIVKNISGTTEISVRDQRDLTNKLKENLNQIREINK